jgi:DNA-binding SARP family transcriptional activator
VEDAGGRVASVGEVRVRLLGSLEVAGIARQAFGSRKARTLVKALALARGKPVSADRLAEICWGDAPPSSPNEQLAVLVSRLRRVLGRDRVVYGDGGYALGVDWLDLDEFEALAEETAHRLGAGNPGGARVAAAAALSLVRGPLLADEAEAGWADLDRAAVGRVIARVHHLAAEAALATGDFADAAEEAGGALDHDPYDESALRILMSAWSMAGRPASALAAYARVRARLGDDLGVDPAPETEALHTAILRGEAMSGVSAPPESLGPAIAARAGSLPGRSAELSVLDEALEVLHPGRAALVEVAGEAGIGKTALLGAYAARAAERGAVVLQARCGELDRALPLQAPLDAIAAHLRIVGPEEASALLADDARLLGPLLGMTGATSDAQSLLGGFAGPTLLYAALLAVVERAAGGAPLALLLDDAHDAGDATVEWLQFARRRVRDTALLIVVTRRPEEGRELSPDERLMLGPLDRTTAEAIVGPERAPMLHERSGGNPLFLVELAAVPDEKLPASILEAVVGRCEAAGAAAITLRTAALLGADIDLDLLAAVTREAPTTLLAHLEEGVRRRLLDERGGSFGFRHELVRDALVASASAGRAALVHREAARALMIRDHPDPIAVAHHARLAGDEATAAVALVDAAAVAAERFDYRTAEELLERSLGLHESTAARLARARVRVLGARYAEAVDDAHAALAAGVGAPALEVAGWAAYYTRDFEAAMAAADDGANLADDPVLRASCLTLGGRTRHAAGDLVGAESQLVRATALAAGPDLAVASAYLGILRSHQSRTVEALDLVRAATRLGGSPHRVGVVFHAYYYTAHAEALAGRPAAALAAIEACARELARRQIERYADLRHENFRAWILRALGAHGLADERNEIALDAGTRVRFRETEAAALIDLAESALLRDDLPAARERLDGAEAVLDAGNAVFAWRQRMKIRLDRAQLALAARDPERAEALARSLADEAEGLGVPRYAIPARLLTARARAQRGDSCDLGAIADDLQRLPGAIALDAWNLSAEVAHDLGVHAWWERGEEQAARLANQTGEHEDRFRTYARQRLDALRP